VEASSGAAKSWRYNRQRGAKIYRTAMILRARRKRHSPNMTGFIMKNFDESIRVIRTESADFFAADFFMVSFGSPFRCRATIAAWQSPRHLKNWRQYVAFYRWSESHFEPVGFCNFIRYGEVYLEGGMCVKKGFYRRLPSTIGKSASLAWCCPDPDGGGVKRTDGLRCMVRTLWGCDGIRGGQTGWICCDTPQHLIVKCSCSFLLNGKKN